MRKHGIVAVALAGLVTTACGGGGGAALAAGEDYTVLGALAELPPAQDDTFLVHTADLTAATERAGLERPEEPGPGVGSSWIDLLSGAPALDPWPQGSGERVPLFVPTPQVTIPRPQTAYEEFAEVAGWSLVDVDSFVEYSTPPRSLTVLAGEFDGSTLAHLPEVTDGVHTVGEGADTEIYGEQRSAVNELGQPVRMVQDEGRLAVSAHTDLVQGWSAGHEESLAEHEELAALATALDDADVVSAMLSVGHDHTLAASGAPPEVLEQLQSRLDLPEEHFAAVAVGWSAEDGQSVITIAHHFASADSAAAAAGQLEAVYTDGLMLSGEALSDLVELVEISTDGPVVVATVHGMTPRAPSVLAQILPGADIPFVHQ